MVQFFKIARSCSVNRVVIFSSKPKLYASLESDKKYLDYFFRTCFKSENFAQKTQKYTKMLENEALNSLFDLNFRAKTRRQRVLLYFRVFINFSNKKIIKKCIFHHAICNIQSKYWPFFCTKSYSRHRMDKPLTRLAQS